MCVWVRVYFEMPFPKERRCSLVRVDIYLDDERRGLSRDGLAQALALGRREGVVRRAITATLHGDPAVCAA